MGDKLKEGNFLHRWDQKTGFSLSTFRNRFQHLLLLKFHHALNIFIKLLLSALVHFHSVLVEESKKICSSHWVIHGVDFKKKAIFSQMRKKVVLTCLRLETSSDIQYFWSFTMHWISSSFFFLRPWCNSAPFYSKMARYSVHLSDSSMGVILKKGNFFTDETKKVVLACLRLETGSNIYYFWSFTMHSISLSNFFLRPWCTSTPFHAKEARISVHLSYTSMMDILQRSNFFTDVKKKLALTCLRLETVSNIYHFWSFTMHSKSSSNFFLRPSCNSTPF